MQDTELPPNDAFYSKLRSCNALEAEYRDYVDISKSGLTTEQAVVKLKLSKPPPTGIESYQYVQQIWKQEQMSSIIDLLRWYNKKDIVPNLEAMQKVIAFYHDKNIDMLKFGCTLPNLANICLDNSTDAKFYPFMEGDQTFRKKFEKMLLVDHISFLHAKHLLMKLLFESLQTYANLLLGLTPANYIPTRCVNPCPPVFTRVGFSIQKRAASYLGKTRPAGSKTWSCPFSNEQDQNVKLKASLKQADKKNDCFSVDGFCSHCNTVFEAMGCFYHFCPVKSCVPPSLKRIFEVGARRECSMH